METYIQTYIRTYGLSLVVLSAALQQKTWQYNCPLFVQVVCSQDPSWWQARLEGEDTIGLIPSLDLEERRKCFVDKDDLKKRFSCCGSGVGFW